MPTQLEKLKQDFLDYLEVEKGRSVKTVQNYDFYLKRFFAFAKINSPAAIDLESVRQFRLWLNRLAALKRQRSEQTDHQGEPLKKSTQNYHLIALRSFLKYLAKRDIKTLASEKIELAKMAMRQGDFLEGHDLGRFLLSFL